MSMTTQTWFRGLVALLLASFIALIVAAVHLTVAARRTVEIIPDLVDGAVAREGEATRASAEQLAADVRGAAVAEIQATRRELLSRVDVLGDRALGEVRLSRDLADRISTRGLDLAERRSAAALDEFIAARREFVDIARPPSAALTKVLDGAEASRLHWSKNLDPWTDCHGNGACWQAQFAALLGASRVTAGETSRTMREVRIATPKIAANVEVTTGNVARLTRPESLGMRVIKMVAPLAGGALFGAIK
jgi:hypothetical protein